MGESFLHGTYTYVVLIAVIASDLTAAVKEQRLGFDRADLADITAVINGARHVPVSPAVVLFVTHGCQGTATGI